MRYYFHPDQNGVKQNFVMEDKQHRVYYEARQTKFNLLRPSPFDFIDHLNGGTVTTHEVGQPVQISEGRDLGQGFRIEFLTDAHFKFDGKKNWEYFQSRGYVIDVSIQKLRWYVTLSRDGVIYAKLESAGKNLFDDEGEEKGLASKLGITGYYRVDCEEEDLADAFMLCFTMARVSM